MKQKSKSTKARTGHTDQTGAASSVDLEALLQHVHDRYDLSPVSAAPIGKGLFTLAFHVQCLDGSYCLKRHRPGTTRDMLAREAGLLADFQAAGFGLTPQVIPDRMNEVTFEHEGALVSLYRLIEADPPFDWTQPSWDSQHCLAAGQALASFHEAGLKLPAWQSLVLSGEKLDAGLAGIVSAALAKLAGEHDPLIERVRNEGQELLQSLDRALAETTRLAHVHGLPTVLAHGDYHPGNLLFRGHEVVGIIDLDYASSRCALFDLGYAGLLFCASWRSGREDGKVERSMLASLVSGYRRMSGPWAAVLDANFELLVPFIRVACLLVIYWLVERYMETSQPERPSVKRALGHSLSALAHLQGS